MHPLRPPARPFAPHWLPLSTPRLQRLGAVDREETRAPDCEIREMEGDVAEYMWLDSIFAEEFQTAFSDSQVLPLCDATLAAPVMDA